MRPPPIRIFLWLVLALVTIRPAPSAAQQPEDTPQPSAGWRRIGEPESFAGALPRASLLSPSSQLALPAGAFVAVRVNEPLSSDHNQPGDRFTATLVQPLVVEGLVIARRGQIVGGRVADAGKAGRVRGTSRLGLELTELSLVDGQQLPVRTELIQYAGDTSKARDATAIATVSGTGAAIGAVADGGFGAGMGALAGAAASTIGVLVTRGRATAVYPEDTLTFRTLVPLTILTERSPHAFQAVTQNDYEPRQLQRRTMTRSARYAPVYPPPFYYSPYGWWSPSLFYGPRLVFFSGPRGFYGRGFPRRW
jgi:hypothetical protein